MAASVLQQSSNQLLNWNHYMIVPPPSGFLNVGSALNGATTTIGNLFMGLGTFIWSVVSWLFQIAINPAFIMDPLFKDLANVYQFAYQSFFLPLLPLLAVAVILYSIYFYFRGRYAQTARVFASSALAILIVLIGFLEFPTLFQIADTLAIGTTSAVMGELESALSAGHITASNQAISGLVNTYLQSPWELMQFGFLSSNPSQYGLQGGVTGSTFSTLAGNLNQVDPSVTSAVLQEQFSTAYPNLITVANPQATPGSGLPSTMTVQGLATNVNGALVPDWRNVFYVYGGQNQQSAIAKSFFVQGQQTVAGASSSNTSGNFDENHFFSGSGNLVLIIIAMLTSSIPLAFAMFTGAQLLWRELNFFFKLGQGIISLPFLMVPEAGPAHTQKWLRQAFGHLIERFGTGVYFAIAVGLGSLLQQQITKLFVGNAETGMIIAMLFLALWYVSAFIYREKLFSMTVHPLAATVAQNAGIAGRGYAQRLQRAEDRKRGIVEATEKERERKEEERKHPKEKGPSEKRAKTIRPFQREQKATSPPPGQHWDRAPAQYSGGNVPLSPEAHAKELAMMRALDRVEGALRSNDDSVVNATESGNQVEGQRGDGRPTFSGRYADAVAWAKGAGTISHLRLKRGLGATDAQASKLLGQMARNGVIQRDGHGFWRAAVPPSGEAPDAVASDPIQNNVESHNEADLEQAEAQPESAVSASTAEASQEGADSYDRAVSWVQGHGATTPFILARRLGVEESAAAALLGRMQENGVVQRGVGQWWKAIPANFNESERSTGVQGEEPSSTASQLSEGIPETPPIIASAETMRDTDSSRHMESEHVAPPQQAGSSGDEQSNSRQGAEPTSQRPTVQPSPTASSVITNQQVGRVKQFTRKIGHAAVSAGQVAVRVAKSQPVRISAKTAGFGLRVTRGTTKLAFKGGTIVSIAAIRAMEWHADRIGTPPGNETFAGEFKRRMLKPSRLEECVEDYGAPAVRGAKMGAKQIRKGAVVGARQINRIPAVRQTHEAVRATGEMVKNKAKDTARDWFWG